MDKHFNDDHGQIPESSQFIPDSTLIPQSEQMYPEADDRGDNNASYGDGGLPGGNGKGVETFQAKKPSFMMKNLPLIVVLLVGAGIGGSFLYKKVLHPSPAPIVLASSQPTEQVPAQSPPVPAPVNAQQASPAAAPLVSEPIASAAQPAPIVPPEPVRQAVPKADVPAPVATLKIEPQALAAVTAPVKPQTAAVPAPLVDARSTKELEAERRRSEALKAELLEMQTRMATLESELHSKRSQPTVAMTQTTSAPTATTEHARHAKHNARVQAAAKKVKAERVDGYSVTAVRNGLAWITTPEGFITVREGDEVPGIGRITRISESAMRVSAGNKFVQ